MMRYDYRVVPAPAKGQKAKGAKSPEERFAATIETSLNTEAETGWEFLRAETLPSQERQGLTGSKTVFQTLLVFRRPATKADADDAAAAEDPPRLLEDRSPASGAEDAEAPAELRAER